MKNKLSLSLLIVLFVFSNCETSCSSSTFTINTVKENIVGKWFLEEYFIDATSGVSVAQDYTEIYTNYGKVYISYKISDDLTFADTGFYSIEKTDIDGMVIHFSGIELVDFYGTNTILFPENAKIRAFKKDNYFEYKYYYNGSYHQFNLVRALNQ